MGSTGRAVALTLLLAVATGCGGGDRGGGTPTRTPADEGDGVAAEAWLADVCGATKDWVDEILALQANLRQNLDTSSAKAVKDSMIGYFGDVLASTDGMLEQIDAAGVPEVEGGRAVAEAVSDGLNDARDVLQRARDDAADLETDDPQVFNRELRAIAREVQSSMREVGDTMAQFRSPELDGVAEDVSECQELQP